MFDAIISLLISNEFRSHWFLLRKTFRKHSKGNLHGIFETFISQKSCFISCTCVVLGMYFEDEVLSKFRLLWKKDVRSENSYGKPAVTARSIMAPLTVVYLTAPCVL